MGTEYRLILLDEFDWAYADTDKYQVIHALNTQYDVTVEGAVPYMIIIDCQRRPCNQVIANLLAPGEKQYRVDFDAAYEQWDNDPTLKKIQLPTGAYNFLQRGNV